MLLQSTWLPWLSCFVMTLLAMLAESLVHVVVFGQRSYLEALLRPAPHELWMRLVIALLIATLAVVWHASVRAHAAHEARMAEYQSRLRELTAQVAHGQNGANKSAAQRLHEGVAQSLAAGRFFLMAEQERSQAVSVEALSSLLRILDRAIADCRDIAQELSPPALDSYGLFPALEVLAGQVMVRTGVSVEVDSAESPSLPEPQLLALYQAVSEVLTCASANPETRVIRVSALEGLSPSGVRIHWDAEEAEDLLDVKERIRLFGGDVSRHVEGGATTVTVSATVALAV